MWLKLNWKWESHLKQKSLSTLDHANLSIYFQLLTTYLWKVPGYLGGQTETKVG